MDIRCPVCGEPWDLDSLHDEVSVRFEGSTLANAYERRFNEVRKDFYRRGCEALGAGHNDSAAHPGIAELYDLLGDDIDGAASLLDDFEALGLLS